jgi:hypothetical protein
MVTLVNLQAMPDSDSLKKENRKALCISYFATLYSGD